MDTVDNEVVDVNIVDTTAHEAAVLQYIATRAFLRPSKYRFERHIHPGVPWRCIRYCWSALSKCTPVVDFWSPCPGIATPWMLKLRFMVHAYYTAGLNFIFL